MSETREVLAPCPFCGCKARILETQTDVVVACEGCCVENHFINDIRDTGRSRAIAAWNRRALSARDERAEERERAALIVERWSLPTIQTPSMWLIDKAGIAAEDGHEVGAGATLSLAGEDAGGLCAKLEKVDHFEDRMSCYRNPDGPEAAETHSAALVAEKRAREEAERDTWWLVERRSCQLWATGRGSFHGLTSDATRAERFASKFEAEEEIRCAEDCFRNELVATEHKFIAAETHSAALARALEEATSRAYAALVTARAYVREDMCFEVDENDCAQTPEFTLQEINAALQVIDRARSLAIHLGGKTDADA